MISAILNGVLFALKLMAFATIICLFTCILVLFSFLLLTSHQVRFSNALSELKPMITPTKERQHNSTQQIVNDVLITPTPKQTKGVKKQSKKSTKSQPQKPQKQQAKLTNLSTQATKKPLSSMTSKELLAYAKQEKIKGYSSVYKLQKKLGLIKLIEQRIEQQPEFSE
jgi:predicted PurR-regulated permease PerM